MFFVSSEGDTITYPLGPSHTLPQRTKDTIPYVLELSAEMSNQNFPIDFDGKLIIKTPTGGFCPQVTFCHIDYSKTTTRTETLPFSYFPAVVYPNPARQQVKINSKISSKKINIYNQIGKLILTIDNYQNNSAIDIESVPDGMILFQIVYPDGHQVIRKIIKK
jgi:hypothetical protein